MTTASPAPLGWPAILRLGLVQTAIGAVVVLTTSAINRVMVVELALPAALPGLLVGLHYAVQVSRPRLGHGSDVGGRRTPWILGGMATLALGGTGAAVATALMADQPGLGLALAVVAFLLVGVGVGASGTALLALLAARTAPARRPAAAAVVWIMMIAGFVATTAAAGSLLDPYSGARLVAVSAGVSVAAFLLATLGVLGVEGRAAATVVVRGSACAAPALPFRDALAQVWADAEARRFTVFVFASMLAYSAQDLILEPYAGAVFGLTLGETTRLASVQHGGVLLGMVAVAVLAGLVGRGCPGGPSLRAWTVGGCAAASAAMLALALGGPALGEAWPLRASYFALGLANGVFAASAIASMMRLAGAGRAGGEGVRLGLWGAAQAVAFGLGGFGGAAAVDVARAATGSDVAAYALAFAADAALFAYAAALAAGLGRPVPASSRADRGPALAGGMAA